MRITSNMLYQVCEISLFLYASVAFDFQSDRSQHDMMMSVYIEAEKLGLTDKFRQQNWRHIFAEFTLVDGTSFDTQFTRNTSPKG